MKMYCCESDKDLCVIDFLTKEDFEAITGEKLVPQKPKYLSDRGQRLNTAIKFYFGDIPYFYTYPRKDMEVDIDVDDLKKAIENSSKVKSYGVYANVSNEYQQCVLRLKQNSKWKTIIKGLNVSEKDMNRAWADIKKDAEEMTDNLNVLQVYQDTLLTVSDGWKCLTSNQMEVVPVYMGMLRKQREEEMKKNQQEKETQKVKESSYEDYFLTMMDNSEAKFSEEEIKDLIYNEKLPVVDRIEGDDHRWQREMETIVKVKDRYFGIPWFRALTEMQEDDFYSQPYEVEPQEKVITVKVWNRK